MFCPNCGAKNSDSANNCNKCGFRLKAGDAGPKFKGTMLMIDASKLPVGDVKAGERALKASGEPAGAPKTPAPGAPGPARPRVAARSKLHGTMLGVAPPSAGAIVPPAAPPQAVVPSAEPLRPQPAASVNAMSQTLVAGTGPAPGAPPARTPAPAPSQQATSSRAFGTTQVISEAGPEAGAALASAKTALSSFPPATGSSPAQGSPTSATATASFPQGDAQPASFAPDALAPDSFAPDSFAPDAGSAAHYPEPSLMATGPMSAFEPKGPAPASPVQDALKLPTKQKLGAMGIFLTIITLGLYLLFRKKS